MPSGLLKQVGLRETFQQFPFFAQDDPPLGLTRLTASYAGSPRRFFRPRLWFGSQQETEGLLSDIGRTRLVPRRPVGNDRRGGSYSQTDRDMEGFNSTGELAGASRSLAGVPSHPSARLCCGPRPSLNRSNLLNAPERNGSRSPPCRLAGLDRVSKPPIRRQLSRFL